MAALGGELSRKILTHSDAEKAFRPWWDTLEDNLLYAFVILGKIFQFSSRPFLNVGYFKAKKAVL